MCSALLNVVDVSKRFGGVRAVDACTFDVGELSVTGLIGPNGAGKSTVVDLISGVVRADGGAITFEGTPVMGLPTYRIARLGVIRTFQIAREFHRLTVMENLLAVPLNQKGETLWSALWRGRSVGEGERANVDRASSLLARFDLAELANELAGNLSGGQKRLLELARALMYQPRLLILDEPLAGVNPSLAATLAQHIRGLPSDGVSVLVIEHNLQMVEVMCDRIVVMNQGSVLAEGNMAELRANPEVVSAYLGVA